MQRLVEKDAANATVGLPVDGQSIQEGFEVFAGMAPVAMAAEGGLSYARPQHQKMAAALAARMKEVKKADVKNILMGGIMGLSDDPRAGRWFMMNWQRYVPPNWYRVMGYCAAQLLVHNDPEEQLYYKAILFNICRHLKYPYQPALLAVLMQKKA